MGKWIEHMRIRLSGCLAVVLVGLPMLAGNRAEAGLPLRTAADAALPGNATRWDYESFDPQRHLLFLAHLGDSTVVAFDTESRSVIGTIPGVSHVHGVLAIPQLGRVYASATGTNEVVAIDEASLRITAHIPAGIYPDGMAYAPNVNKLYVSDETGATDTAIDVKTNKPVATIALGGKVGNTQYDPGSGHIFVNAQGRGQLAEIDPRTDQVVASYGLAGCQGNHGLLIDAHDRSAFIACEENDKLLVVDMHTMRITARYAVGRTPDVLAYDDGLGWLYVACESGDVSMFAVRPNAVEPLGKAVLGSHAHSVAVDPQTHRAFFPLMESPPVLRITEPSIGYPHAGETTGTPVKAGAAD